MPGLVFQADKYELSVNTSATRSESGTYYTHTQSYDGINETTWVPVQALPKTRGILIYINGQKPNGGSATATATLEIPALSVSQTESCSFSGATSSLTFNNLRVYFDGTWIVAWDSISWLVDGVEKWSDTDGNISGGWQAPAGIPLFGCFPRLYGEARATLGIEDLRSVVTNDGTSICDLTVTGGWRFYKNSTWYTPPVTLDVKTASSDCSSSSLTGILDVSTTYDSTITSHAESTWDMTEGDTTVCPAYPLFPFTEYTAEVVTRNSLGSITLTPDMPKSFKRFNDDFEALILRYGIGGGSALYIPTESVSADSDHFNVAYVLSTGAQLVQSIAAPTPDVCTEDIDVPVFSEMDTLLSTVGNTTHAIEDIFQSSPALYTVSNNVTTKEISYIGEGYTGDPSGEFAFPDVLGIPCIPGYTFPVGSIVGVGATSEFLGIDPQTNNAGYLIHDDPLVRYVNGWVNPHYSLFLWFPEDDQVAWYVDSDPAPASQYWLPIREQYIHHPDLPEDEDLLIRNSLVSNPLNDGLMPDAIGASFGNQRWLGISHWITQDIDWTSNITLDSSSSSRWEDDDCTLSFGSDIEVTPSAGVCTIKFQMGDLGVTPYLYPLFAKSVQVGWTNTNISSVSVSLEGIDGISVLLGTAETTYDLITGDASKYAGSWAIDNGAGIVTDTGSDSIPANGISSATMVDPIRSSAFQLLTGFQPKYLVFTITPTNPSNPVHIDYPNFIRSTSSPLAIWESGQCCSLLNESGPGFRLGNQSFWNIIDGLHNPPDVFGLGYKESVVDWLAMRNLAFKGVAYNDNLSTELASLFDSYAGNSVDEVAQLTIAFLLPKGSNETMRSALVPCLGEVPPLAAFPWLARDTDDWSASGDLVQECWEFAQSRRYLISNGVETVQLLDNSNVDWLTDEVTFTGWKIKWHTHTVDNTETDFKIWKESKEWAEVRPWHGFFCLLSISAGGEDLSCIHHWASNEYYTTYIKQNDVYVLKNTFSIPITGYSDEIRVTSTGNNTQPAIGVLTNTILYVVYHNGTDVVYRFSPDQGSTWSDEITLITDAYFPRVAVSPTNDILWAAFKYNSGTSGPGKIYVIPFGPGETSIPSAIVLKDETGTDIQIEDVGFDISFSSDRHGRWLFFVRLSGETGLSHYASSDFGLTATKVYP